jgi:hypothetical protein
MTSAKTLTGKQMIDYWQPFRNAANAHRARYWCDKGINAEVSRAYLSTSFLKFNRLL